MYLGKKLKHMQLQSGIWVWSICPSKYVQKAVSICEEYVAKHLSKGYKFSRMAENPFKSSYCPELDVSLVLGPDKELILKCPNYHHTQQYQDRGFWRLSEAQA